MEFRPIRRRSLSLGAEESERILKEGICGVLSVTGDGGIPYGVPVNYVYDGTAIYIHSATEGHKTDALKNNSAVSFTVIGRHEVRPEKFATAYTSVIVFGSAEIVGDAPAKTAALRALAAKYAPDEDENKVSEEIAAYFDKTAVIKIVPEHISGKRGAAD